MDSHTHSLRVTLKSVIFGTPFGFDICTNSQLIAHCLPVSIDIVCITVVDAPSEEKKVQNKKNHFKGIIIHTYLKFNRCLLCRIGVAVLISWHVDPVHGGVALARHVAHVHVVRPHLVVCASENN